MWTLGYNWGTEGEKWELSVLFFHWVSSRISLETVLFAIVINHLKVALRAAGDRSRDFTNTDFATRWFWGVAKKGWKLAGASFCHTLMRVKFLFNSGYLSNLWFWISFWGCKNSSFTFKNLADLRLFSSP